MELVQANKQPFMAATGSMEARYCDQEFGLIKLTSRMKDGVPRKAYMDSKGSMEIQKGGGQTPKGDYNCALHAY